MYFDWMADSTNEWQGKDLDNGPHIMHNNVDMSAYESRMRRGTVFSAE